MAEAVFRKAAQPTPEPKAQEPVKEAEQSTTSGTYDTGLITAYEHEKGHPYAAEYFEITTVWDKGLDGGFSDEARAIDSFLHDLIKADRLENKIDSAKKYLKGLEKEAGIDSTERTVRRIAKLNSFINYKRMVLDLNGEPK